MKKYLIFFIMTCTFVWAQEPDFGSFKGNAVIVDMTNDQRTVYGNGADERLNPCSTFKILHSLIALDTHVIADENTTLKWDGTIREYPSWNKDHSMRSAIAVSAVWFYQSIAKRIGEQRMQPYVEKARYGNADTSKQLTNFWLGGGSLKISPNEQADFLMRLVNNELSFSTRALTTVKDIITLHKEGKYVFAGKTGSCNNVGWFVGFEHNNDKTEVFVFELQGENADGSKAKKVAYEYYHIKP